MNIIVFMIPAVIALGAVGLAAFIWSLRSGQFDDPAGSAARILNDQDHPD
jgi:cbb3-type cytochrome oxidase maturation protein